MLNYKTYNVPIKQDFAVVSHYPLFFRPLLPPSPPPLAASPC